MSDPIEDLQNFNSPGLNVNPLPASEVRRRGDRLRHRNNALAAVGGALAVAIIAVPLALGANGSDRSAPGPADTPSPSQTTERGDGGKWLQAIPPDFPLTEGMPATNGNDGSPVTMTETSGIDDLTLCGRPAWSATSDEPVRAADVAGATYAGESEDSEARTLALYPSDEAAGQTLGALQAGLDACPADPNGSGATQVYDVVAADLGEESFVFTQRSRDASGFLGDLSVYQAVRVGNAVYLATTYAQGGANQQLIDYAVDLMATRSTAVVSDLCIFSAEPCRDPAVPEPSPSGPDSSPATGEGAVSAIPADFPLDRDLVPPEGDPLDGPSADAVGVPPLDLCGRSAWPVDGVERLAVTATGPEYRESRELVTFSRTADVTAALDAIRQAVQDCPVISADRAADDQILTIHPAGLAGADDTVTFSTTYREGLGGGIVQFARVGRGLIGTFRGGEWSLDTVPAGVDEASARTEAILPDMCVFTEAGC